jgi:hypothetical protein
MPFVLLPPLVFALEQMVRFEQQLGRARRASLTRRLRESQRLRAADALCDGRIRTEKHFRPGRGHTRCRDAQHVGHVFRCAESALRRQLHHEAGRGALDHQRLVRRAVDARPLTLHRADNRRRGGVPRQALRGRLRDLGGADAAPSAALFAMPRDSVWFLLAQSNASAEPPIVRSTSVKTIAGIQAIPERK